MIVACPNCHTQFEFDAARVATASVKLKCSRCRCVFPAPVDKKQAPPAPPPRKRERPPLENLELRFEEADWREGSSAAEQLSLPDTDEPYTLGTEEEKRMRGEDLVVESPAPMKPKDPISLDPMFEQDDDEFDQPPAESEEAAPAPRESGMMWTILVFLGLVLLGYAGVTAAFFADPAWRDQILGQLPFVAGNDNDRLLHRKIALAEVTGSHQSVKDDKNVFVISGKAYNTAAEPLVNVQVLGSLLDADGREVGRKAIHLGNIISTKVLTEMTRKEIEVFHNLNVSWRNIEPGQSYPFVIVFTDPPKNATEFTAKVIGALRQRG